MPHIVDNSAAVKPLAPTLSSSLESRRSGSRGKDLGADGAAPKPPPAPLDVETQGVDARGLSALDRRIDRALLPCLCMISVANYLGEG